MFLFGQLCEIYGIDNPQLRDIRASGSYTGNRMRGELTASKLELESGASFDIYRTSLSTTLGFADGSLGMSSIVDAPFALINKHETLILKMLNARESKDKIVQEVKFNTISCTLEDVDGWQQYVSEYLDQILEEDEQSFEKLSRW